jgi:hypothetical protein
MRCRLALAKLLKGFEALSITNQSKKLLLCTEIVFQPLANCHEPQYQLMGRPI